MTGRRSFPSFRSWLNKARAAQPSQRKPAVRLALHNLESREVPAAFSVTTGADDGAGSLRAAIAQAAASPGADTITFAPGVTTVSLTTSQLSLSETSTVNAVTIDGGKVGVTISRDAAAPEFFGILKIANNTTRGVFRNLTFTGGAGQSGGAIENRGVMEVIGCTFVKNSSTTNGGAIFNGGNNSSYIVNSTFSENDSSGAGGAIYHASGDIYVNNCTIVGNLSDPAGFNAVPPQGAGLFTDDNKGSALVYNTIFADNLTTNNVPSDIQGKVAAASQNNIVTSTKFAGDMTPLNQNQIGIASTSFLVKPLADNGGPTKTYLITGNAINKGNDAFATDQNADPLTVDQRGLPRLFGAVDIGAVEIQNAVAPPPPGGGGGAAAIYAIGAGPGGSPIVRVYDPATNKSKFDVMAFDRSFRGGVHVAAGDDVNGDGVADFVAAAASNGGPHVKVFDGANGKLIREFFAYDAKFTGGVNLCMGDVDGDGKSEIITAAASNGGPHVRVFNAATGAVASEFFAYDAKFTGGVSVGSGDLNGDGKVDIVTGAGPGGGPHVKAFDLAQGNKVIKEVFAFDAAYTGGVNVAVGDVNGDGQADIVCGANKGVATVRILEGKTLGQMQLFPAFDRTFTGGVNVSVADTNNDGVLDILAGAGPSAGPHVRSFRGTNAAQVTSFLAFDPAFTGGVFVG